jgi:hypothetical protein
MRNAHANANRRRIAGRSLAALALLLCAGFVATPAQAGNEFRDGFEDQLGRLVAVEAFHVGRLILTGGHPGYTTQYVSPTLEAPPQAPPSPLRTARALRSRASSRRSRPRAQGRSAALSADP